MINRFLPKKIELKAFIVGKVRSQFSKNKNIISLTFCFPKIPKLSLFLIKTAKKPERLLIRIELLAF